LLREKVSTVVIASTLAIILSSFIAIDGSGIHGGALSRISQLCAALKRRI